MVFLDLNTIDTRLSHGRQGTIIRSITDLNGDSSAIFRDLQLIWTLKAISIK